MKVLLINLFTFCLLLFSTCVYSQVADTIIFQKYGHNQRYITVEIAEKKYRFLFDAGAGSTFISEELANTLKIKSTGVINTFSKEGKRQIFSEGDSLMLKIGKSYLMQKQVLITNNFKSTTNALPRIDGTVSLKTFEGSIISFDFENNLLLIESNQSFKEKLKMMLPLESSFSNGISGKELFALLNVTVKGNPLSMKFDTGNLDKVLLSKQSALELNLAKDSILQLNEFTNTGEVGFMIQSSVGENLATSTRDLIYDGVFNYAFISGYAFTLDLNKQKVYLLPY